MTGFGNSNGYSETQGKVGVGLVVIMKVEHAWVCYSRVERMDSLGSKNEHSLTSTKTVKNLWLITMKTHCYTTLTYLPPLPFPQKKNLYALNEFTEKNIKLVTYRKNTMFQ